MGVLFAKIWTPMGDCIVHGLCMNNKMYDAQFIIICYAHVVTCFAINCELSNCAIGLIYFLFL